MNTDRPIWSSLRPGDPRRGLLLVQVASVFEKVVTPDAGSCWMVGCCVVSIRGRVTSVARLMYEWHHGIRGPFTAKSFKRSCGGGKHCVNPRHLTPRWGENSRKS